MTPFGNPVVPLEYTKNAKSTSGSTFTFTAPAPFPLTSAKCLNRPSASLSSPINNTLSLSNPASRAASNATGNSAICVTSAFAPASFSMNASSWAE